MLNQDDLCLVRRALAPIICRPVHNHMLRHSFTSRLGEPAPVYSSSQEVLRHPQITTTTMCAHRGASRGKARCRRAGRWSCRFLLRSASAKRAWQTANSGWRSSWLGQSGASRATWSLAMCQYRSPPCRMHPRSRRGWISQHRSFTPKRTSARLWVICLGSVHADGNVTVDRFVPIDRSPVHEYNPKTVLCESVGVLPLARVGRSHRFERRQPSCCGIGLPAAFRVRVWQLTL